MGDLKRILIVDDEPKNQRLIKDFLDLLGHSSEPANDGLEALEKLKSGFDLVLLDVMMPGMDGFDVVRHIRGNPEFADIPVIMVTVLDDKKTRIRAVEAGANDFINKPIDRLELSVRIESLLKMKDAQDIIKRHQAELEETVQERTAQLLEYNERLKVELADRKCAEAELLASEMKYRSLFEESTDGIFINQLDDTLVDANRSFLDLFGYEREEIIGKPDVITCFDPSDRAGFRSEIETKGYARDYPIQLRKKDGTIMDCLVSGSVRRTADGKMVGYRGIVRDVTAQKSLQSQLLQAQKMEAIGTLAGGIAHDFSNLLQVVVGYSELMIMNPALPDAFKRGIKSINKAALSGADLVGRLLTFGRKTETKPGPLNLNDKITQISEFLDRTISKMIQIELKLSKNSALIHADSSQIEQIIMNLVVNASHAMPEGGNLVIETETVNLDRAYCLVHVEATPGPHILLSVSDSGSGMDEETMERIFEPFFTTKDPGTGTGLGLAMVYGIVKEHGGHLKCYSQPGAGTTFKIYFPAMVYKIKPDKPSDLVVAAGGTETILLVDDNKSVRDVGREMLREHGYCVITASNGREALNIYSTERENISLVILDMSMPVMGGKECLLGLLKLDPKVRVLMVSGFMPEGEIKDALDLGAGGYIRKPFEVPRLLEKIRKIINEE